MNEKEERIYNTLSNGEELQMRVKKFSSLPKSWFEKFPRSKYSKYYTVIKSFEGEIVHIESLLSNGAILIKESSMAFGCDVLEFIEDSFLDDDLFEI